MASGNISILGVRGYDGYQLLRHLAHIAVSFLRIAAACLKNKSAQGVRQLRRFCGRIRDVLSATDFHQGTGAVLRVRSCTRNHLIRGNSQSVNIAPLICRFAVKQLRHQNREGRRPYTCRRHRSDRPSRSR